MKTAGRISIFFLLVGFVLALNSCSNKNDELFQACQDGNVDKVRQLLDSGANINSKHDGKPRESVNGGAPSVNTGGLVKGSVQLMENGVNPDTRKYLLLLYASAETLLSVKGYTAESICDAVNGYSANSLSKYLT